MIKKYSLQEKIFFLSKLLTALSWALLIFVVLSKPMPVNGLNVFVWRDKVAHFILFGVLAVFIIYVFYDKQKDNFKKIAYFSALVSIFYAYFCEYWQQYVPGRFQDNLDLLAGFLGILFFIYFGYKFLQIKKPKMLLHICCAGCGAYVTEILKKRFRVILYYYNPNIYPPKEYERRLRDLEKVCSFCSVKHINARYDHQAWLNKVKGYENEPEKGERCRICFQDRLKKTAQFAKKKKFDYFCTTLTVSAHKDFVLINKIGKEMEEKYGILFLQENFKKKDGAKKSAILSRGLGLYRQDYCGCEFSMRDKN